jgi:hypothetical protein
VEAIGNLYREMRDWLSKPFTEDMPISRLLLIFILFLIVAFIVWDALRILKDWTENATEAVVDAVT